MKAFFSAYIIFLLCTGAFIPYAHGQKENADSLLNERMIKLTKPDDLYFDAIKAKNQNDVQHAKELFEQFVALRPDVSAGYYELAKLYYNEKKRDKAAEDIKKAIALDGHNKWYYEQYASILAEQGNYLEAAKITADLCRREPGDEEYPKMAAEYFERGQQYDSAVHYIDMALQRSGDDDEELFNYKVALYLEMNQADKAASAVQQLIAKDPMNGKYYKWLGEIYDNNKLPAKATETYSKALQLLPEDPSVQTGMADHYLKTGDTANYKVFAKKAILNKDLDAATQLDNMNAYLRALPTDSIIRIEGLAIMQELAGQHPGDAQVQASFGDFLDGNNKSDSAAIAYKLSLAIKPADFKVWERLFNIYADSKGADSLVKYTEKAMRLFPNLGQIHYYNGIGHYNKKDYPGAVKALKRAIDMEPETEKPILSRMYALLADVYHSTKQDDLSDKAFEQSLKMDNDNPGTLNNYSYYLSERGQKLDEAEKMSKRAIELMPGEATYLDTYGWIQYKKGNYEVAKTFIQHAVDLAGANADATLYNHLGNVYYKLNDKEKAAANWKIAKDKGSDDPLIDKKISEGKLYE